MTATHTAATAGAPAPGRSATHHGAQRVTAALYVDFGDSSRPPRARYECMRCRTTEGPVIGPDAVAAFVAGVRTDHHTRCPGPQEHRS